MQSSTPRPPPATSSTTLGYIRVSTEEQSASGLGLDAQAAAIRAYCALRRLPDPQIIADAAVSGGRPLADRPGGAALLTKVAARGERHVIILRLDRAFRRASDALATIDQWRARGVHLHVIDMGGAALDITTAVGKLLLSVAACTAEFERDIIGERTRAALRVKRDRGERIGSIPYGFMLDSADDSGAMLVENPAEQRGLRIIERLAARGRPLRRIAAVLDRLQIPTKKGKSWQHQSVACIVRQLRRASAAASPSATSGALKSSST